MSYYANRSARDPAWREEQLAGLWQHHRRDLWTLCIAIVSAAIAIGSLVVSIIVAVTS